MTKAWELSQHLAPDEAADRFFTDAQFSCGGFHVEGLAL